MSKTTDTLDAGPLAGVPNVAAYRIKEEAIDHSTCLGRVMGPEGGDKRWYPAIYRESQCGKKVIAGSTLCTTCARREAKWADADIQVALKHHWCGRVTEPVSDYQHTAGTSWAAGLLEGHERPVWIGEAAASLHWRTRSIMAAAIRAVIVEHEKKVAALQAKLSKVALALADD